MNSSLQAVVLKGSAVMVAIKAMQHVCAADVDLYLFYPELFDPGEVAGVGSARRSWIVLRRLVGVGARGHLMISGIDVRLLAGALLFMARCSASAAAGEALAGEILGRRPGVDAVVLG